MIRFGWRRPAQTRFYARQEFVQRKRLGNVIVGSQLEREDLVDFLILCGQHDYRHRARFANLFARFHAVEHRQHDVEYDQVRLFVLRHSDSAAPVAGGDDFITAALEVVAQRLQDRRLVVNDEDFLVEIGVLVEAPPFAC